MSDYDYGVKVMCSPKPKYVFISHSNRPGDYEITNRLYKFLTDHKVCCWYDGLLGAGNWRKQISVKLIDASVFILVASKNSLTSGEVAREGGVASRPQCSLEDETWQSASVESKDAEIEKQSATGLNSGKPCLILSIDDYIDTPDAQKGALGYLFGDRGLQIVYLNKFGGDEERAFMRLLQYLDEYPGATTRLENNPADFSYDYSGEVLKAYGGSDSVVVIPEYVTEIGERAFQNCRNLERVIIHDRVKKLGNGAFIGCSSLELIEGAEGVSECGKDCIYGTKLYNDGSICSFANIVAGGDCESREVFIPEGTRTIADCAFMGGECEKLHLNSGLENIGTRAFADCTALTGLTIPSSVKRIDKNAFEGCFRLREVIFEGEIKPQFYEAFCSDTVLKNY